ncbi:MAG: type II toxin-antitoxin system RelE/ParE family toxin [Verrucomicrobia bacterium]|nr:type II toxin-antitoxin system RelE/ParE family toxin [Verrucomicrobiota bacterium]
MSLAIQKADFFKQDFANQFGWYVDEAGADVARRFQAALDLSLNKLARQPDLGRVRHFRNPRLHGLRSFQIERPFNRLLVFYRVSADCLHAGRLMHGTRDLSRRLTEPPGSDAG